MRARVFGRSWAQLGLVVTRLSRGGDQERPSVPLTLCWPGWTWMDQPQGVRDAPSTMVDPWDDRRVEQGCRKEGRRHLDLCTVVT